MLWTKATTRKVGEETELFARSYLEGKGLTHITSNFHSKSGEIDLIFREQNTLVFVEVKYRKSAAFGGPLSAVSQTKQQKLRSTAAFYMQQCGINENSTACRFDVIGLLGPLTKPEVTWLKNAF